MKKLIFIIFFLLFQESLISQKLNDNVALQVPEKEYQALVDIYNQLNGANWGTSNGWKKWSITENNLHEEPWSGVTVENGHVTGLDLYYFYNVKGKLPESIKNLEYLKYLNLSSYYYKKDLSGTDWNVISKLKDLETLNLYGNNNIQGALPESWGELQKLKNLYIGYNSIDQLPSTIGNMISLTRLEANNNQIKEIPKTIAKTKLEYIYLSYNNIQKVPKELEEIKSLKNIYLDYNQISEIEGLLPYEVAYYDLRNQTVSLPLLQYKGEDVEISLPPIFLYNRSKNDFSQKTKIQVYLKGSQVGEALTVSDEGVVILPKSYLSTIKKGDDLYLRQDYYNQNNTYMGSNELRFTKIEIDLPKVPEKEYQVLLDIYNQMNGANWGTSNGWKKWSIT
ncbi:leucine-rich repeat domain-containing protein, partial [uncultured Apibacter sp.]|uniref:leucine-rich repeat domain-containing protein n=1 Tax=uncultured Apibacter sp. TaxID=1778616 RepID=UPI0025CCD846